MKTDNEKPISKRQAWLKIADAYDKYHETKDFTSLSESGLCGASEELLKDGGIDFTMHFNMFDQIIRYKNTNQLPAYFWETDAEHAKNRAKLARKFANE